MPLTRALNKIGGWRNFWTARKMHSLRCFWKIQKGISGPAIEHVPYWIKMQFDEIPIQMHNVLGTTGEENREEFWKGPLNEKNHAQAALHLLCGFVRMKLNVFAPTQGWICIQHFFSVWAMVRTLLGKHTFSHNMYWILMMRAILPDQTKRLGLIFYTKNRTTSLK